MVLPFCRCLTSSTLQARSSWTWPSSRIRRYELNTILLTGLSSNASFLQVGDGTTSVVLIAAELLRRANELMKNRIHPTTIINGYRLALREAVKYMNENVTTKVENLGKDSLVNIAKTSMSSKIIGADSDFFANLCVDAMLQVKSTNVRNETKYPVKAVNLLKAHGKSGTESVLVNGYALNCTVASQAMKTRVSDAKIACLDMNLQKERMKLGVQITVEDPDQLEKIRERAIETDAELGKTVK